MVTAELVNGKTLPYLHISFIDTFGNIKFTKLGINNNEMFEWDYKNEEQKEQKIFKKSELAKRKTKYLSKYRINELLHQAPQNIQDLIFNKNTPKLYFIDIETEVLDGVPQPEDPQAQILTIAIANEKEEIRILGLKHCSPNNIGQISAKINEYFIKFNRHISISYEEFETESDMLYRFLGSYVLNMTALTGWNFIEFDWKYIIARAKKIGLDPTICSTNGKLKYDSTVPHKVIVDYLQLYNKYDTSVGMKENGTLDWVSEAILGVQKVKYNGSLNDLYKMDFFKFVFYNAVDSYLVRLIHEKINAFEVFLLFSYVNHVEIMKAWSPVHMTEMLINRELLKEGKVFVPPKRDYDAPHEDSDGYEGAMVLKPVPGLYKWVACFDYASLYPTTIRQYNISPDVYLGKNIENTTDIKTINNCYFKKNKDGVLRTAITNLFTDRKTNKNIAMEIETEIKFLQDEYKKRKIRVKV